MPKYRVTFLPAEVAVEVDPADAPFTDHGAPGSILDIALAHGVAIEHACGGCGACSTCHVIVEAGAENLREPSDEELDMVDLAPGASLNSRLACLAVVRGDVTVRVPHWNRNAVSESD